MKKIIALVLSLMMLLICAAAMAETAEKEDMGVLKVNKAFNIKYSKLTNGYEVNIQTQNDMTIIANIVTKDKTLPRMNLTDFSLNVYPRRTSFFILASPQTA